MKKFLLAGASLLALGVAQASAADLPARMPAKAPAYVAPMTYNWTGFYLGLNGGYGFGRSEFNGTLPSGSFDTSGGLFGATVGYNWQTGPVVFGLEGDIDWSDMKDTFTSGACPTGCQTKNNWLGTVRGRVGYAIDRVMPYVTGGLAVGDVEANQGGFAGNHDTKAGWAVGGGVEAALAGNWTAKVEYLHADLGSVDCNTGCALPTRVGFHSDIVRGGLNYRF
jgi:outer membrane immunogenic protein